MASVKDGENPWEQRDLGDECLCKSCHDPDLCKETGFCPETEEGEID